MALRSSYEARSRHWDPLLWLVVCAIFAAVAAFAVTTTASWSFGLWFTAGVAGAFGFLLALSRLISSLLKRVFPDHLPFPWRQGLANLYRPNNQTTAVMLAVGLGTFLLVTLYNVRHTLVGQLAEREAENEANLVLFDVQNDQRRDLSQLLDSFGLKRYGEVPVVTMRLAAVKGRRVEDLRQDPSAGISRWALRREYRSTYRNKLAVTEKLVKGTWQGKIAGGSESIPVSVEKGIAETLKVDVGDTLEFEIQGVSLLTRVANLREVDWQRVRPNFFVVFPEGVLENAPQFYVVVARAASPQAAANFQRAVVERFGNVSVIDLTLILNTLNTILSRVSAAIRYVALFTILTGIAVLAGAVLSSRSQRLKESILLRTLGAPRRQIIATVLAEYVFLGAISALAGTLLALLATWGLSWYFFNTVGHFSVAPLLAIPSIVTAVTVGAGALACWGIFRRSALEALRAEA
jgi:putative ABC transport system permease protein